MNANEAIGAARDRARRLVRQERFRRRYGVPAPPWWSDLTGYEALLAVVERERLHELEGDVLEIGVFLGGGTKKLCAAFGRLAPTKRVIAVDVFDLDFDRTANASGAAQADLYNGRIRWWAGTGDQRAVFERGTPGCRNLVALAGDSTKVEIPADRLCFAFVDGHH